MKLLITIPALLFLCGCIKQDKSKFITEEILARTVDTLVSITQLKDTANAIRTFPAYRSEISRLIESNNKAIKAANAAIDVYSKFIDSLNKMSSRMQGLTVQAATITLTNKQLSDKMATVETAIANQTKLNTKLIADTLAKGKRIVALEKDLSSFKKRIDSLTLIPATTDFMIEGKSFRIKR